MSVLSETDYSSYSMAGLNLKNSLGVNALTRSVSQSDQGGEESAAVNKGLLNSRISTGLPGSALAGPFDRDSLSNDLGAKTMDTGAQSTILEGRTGTILSKLV